MDRIVYLFVIVCVLMTGCEPGTPEKSLVITQTPVNRQPSTPARDILDLYYPEGSRVVLLKQPYSAGEIKILSKRFFAAGSPYVSWDSKTILFVGKEKKDSDWQIYMTTPSGTSPVKLTDLPGGAMSPAMISDGSIVFCSPVPKINQGQNTNQPSIYKRLSNGKLARLSFTPKSIFDLTVLKDGRILYVADVDLTRKNPGKSLYTINSDGTEVSRFAIDNDGVPYIRRPRELQNKTVCFLASSEPVEKMSWAESVNMARPFQSRAKLFNFSNMKCSSIECSDDDSILVCIMNYGLSGRTMTGSYGVYKLPAGSNEPGAPLFDDPGWNEFEAVMALKREKPLGKMSSVDTNKSTGNILCIDSNFHRQKIPKPSAVRVNVLTILTNGLTGILGWSEVEKDGSFLLEVPADTPIGFETIDSVGNVIYRVEPVIWIRPGENRSCIGCHEPYNRAPKNYRPIAANSEPKTLKSVIKLPAQQSAEIKK